jgi:hypothetical protein
VALHRALSYGVELGSSIHLSMTPRQLILRRGGTVDWTEIAAIDKKALRASYKGARHQPEYIRIKLTQRRRSAAG